MRLIVCVRLLLRGGNNAMQPITVFPWALTGLMLVCLWWKYRKLKPVLEETVRALIGYYLLLLCARTMQWTLSPLQSLTQLAFGANGGVLNSEVYAALLLEQYGNPAMLALVVAFCVNLLLARWTRGKGVYTTGHHFLYTAMFTVFLFSSGTSLPAPVVVLLGGVFTGTWCWFTATYNRRMTQRVVGQSGVCMANSCIFASVIGLVSGKIAPDDKRYGNESDWTVSITYHSSPLAECCSFICCCASAPERSRVVRCLVTGYRWPSTASSVRCASRRRYICCFRGCR